MPVSEEKEAYAKNMNRLLDTYNRIMFCRLDNVTSQQLHKVRADLRGVGELLGGKKTMQKKIISIRAESDSATALDKKLKEKLCDDVLLSGNVALLFTNSDYKTVLTIAQKHRKQAPARVGVVAPVDVIVPAGNTGMEPTMTSFFQALNINTKIAKGTVEILADKKVLTAGEKVDSSTAALLQKLKISPFFYMLEIDMMWERGTIFTAEDLAISDDDIEKQAMAAINNLTALSLATGIITECSFPHVVLDGFKSLLAASVASGYEFAEFDGKQRRKDIIEGKSSAPAAAAAAPAAAAASGKKAAVEEEEDEDDFGGLGGLF